jgi:hypothetical protein
MGLFRRSLRVCLAALLAAATAVSQSAEAQTTQSDLLENSAVILAYFHVGDDGSPTSNLELEDFNTHLSELTGDDIKPLPVPAIVAALKLDKNIAPGAIGLTFEGAYKSLLDKAIPALLEKHIPFTVFVAPQALDEGNPQYMSWDDIAALKRNSEVSFGLTLPVSPADELEARRMINSGVARFREKLGAEPRLFAYPQGEYTAGLKTIVKAAGFDAAFGLQSGAVGARSDFLALPRFTMTDNYGDLGRLEIVARTRPLPVHDLQPEASLLDTEDALIGFSLDRNARNLASSIRCFASNQGKIELQVLGDARIEIRPHIGRGERLRVNCTAPVPSSDPDTETLRWIGFFLIVKDAPGANTPEPDAPPPPPE